MLPLLRKICGKYLPLGTRAHFQSTIERLPQPRLHIQILIFLPIFGLSMPAHAADSSLDLSGLTSNDPPSDLGSQPRRGEWRAMASGFAARKHLPKKARARIKANSAERLSASLSAPEPVSKAFWLYTKDEGLYQIPVTELAARTPWHAQRLRRMLRRGNPLALINTGKNVPYHYDAAKDALVFFAAPYRSIHSDENAYQLAPRQNRARAMEVQTGQGPEPGTPSVSFRETLHFEEEPDSMYSPWSVYDDPEADYWFWDFLFTGYQDSLDIDLQLPDALHAGQGELRIAMRGFTNLIAGPDHRVRALLNGNEVGNAIEWDGFEQATLVIPFDQSLLNDDEQNTLTLETINDSGSSGQWLDWIDVAYWRAPIARDGQLMLHALEPGAHTVGGLSSSNPFLIEAPNSDRPIVREDFTVDQALDGTFQVTFEALSGGDFFVAEPLALEQPRIDADLPSRLKKRWNRADYLIIAPRSLAGTAQALLEYRSADFPNIRIVWLDDIYQEFSAGRGDPMAISAFLRRVKRAWRGVPEVVTLIGRGTLDHKDRLETGESQLPLRMALTPWGLAPSDNLYVDTDGDRLMDFAYARLPVSDEAAGHAYLNKLKKYEDEAALYADTAYSAVLAADNPDAAGDFHLNTQLLAAELEDYGYEVKMHLHVSGEEKVENALTASGTWNTAFVGYDGHGARSQIGNSGEDFLKVDDVPNLTNSVLPIFSALTCAVGDDSYPRDVSLASSLVLSDMGGAIAALAPTGLSLDADAQVMGAAFAALLLGERLSIGEAARQTQELSLGLVSPFMLDIYQVFGEPVVKAQ